MADFTTTISALRCVPLAAEEQARTGFNSKFSILSSDIALAAATGSTDTVTVTLGPTPTRWYVDKALGYVSTAFAGTTALTAEVGSTTSTAAFISAQSVLTTGILEQTSTLPILTNAMATASVNLQVKFTNSTGGSPSALTAGAMDVYLNVQDATKLP